MEETIKTEQSNKARHHIKEMNEGATMQGFTMALFVVPDETEEFTIKDKKFVFEKFKGKITRELKENILLFFVNSKLVLKITGELFDRSVKILNSIYDVELNDLEYFTCMEKERESLLLIKCYGVMIVIAPRVEGEYD